jgi:hypothetical protein
MIASLEKKEDLERLAMFCDIAEIAIRLYKKTNDPYQLEQIQYWHGEIEKLSSQLDGDYTERDTQQKNIDELLSKIYHYAGLCDDTEV